MKKILGILTAALFTFGAVPAFADDLPDLYPAPPLEKPDNSVQKHRKVLKAKKAQKTKKAGEAKKAVKKKARKVHKNRH